MEGTKQCLKFLLLGKTGNGKSATGNTMLGTRIFTTSSAGTSSTAECEDFFREFKDYYIHVVDTPGLLDTRFNEQQDLEDAAKIYSEALARCHGSIQAFLLVIKFQTRFTAEENMVIQKLAAIFGDNFFSHVITVITGGDDFQEAMEEEGENITFKDWCGKQTGQLAALFKHCDHRVVLFNNREKTKEGKDTQLNQIIEIVKDWEPYTSECFNDANQKREELIAKHKASILRQEFQMAICKIQLEVYAFTKTMSSETKERIIKEINELLEKIKKDENDKGLQKELEINFKQMLTNLDNKNELSRLNKELDDLRKAQGKWKKFGIVSKIASGLMLLASIVLGFVPIVGPALAAAASVAAESYRLLKLSRTAIRPALLTTSADTSVASVGNINVAKQVSKMGTVCEEKEKTSEENNGN